jgi:acetyl-CoA carboxylase alpha subunit
MAATLKASLLGALDGLDRLDVDDLLRARYRRLMQYGRFEEA